MDRRLRIARPLAALPLLALPICAQNTGADVPASVLFVPGSATPQQQWPGDFMQLYEPGAVTGNNCASNTTNYYCGPTNALALTHSPAGNPAGVWGHDEGPSVELIYPNTDNRLLIFRGDSVTAYDTGNTHPNAYQTATCPPVGGQPNACLGVDTVSLVPDVSSFSDFASCTYMRDLDFYLLGQVPALPSYSGGIAGEGGTCPLAAYIVDTVKHDGTTYPWAGFTYEHTTGLARSEDMLGGHIATGAFVIKDPVTGNSDLYVVYLVQTQKGNSGRNFATESVLLNQDNANGTGGVGPAQMPNLARLYPFSTVPNGTVSASGGVDDHVLCARSPSSRVGVRERPGRASTSMARFTRSSRGDGGKSLTVGGPPYPAAASCGLPFPYSAIPVEGNGPGRFMYASPVVLTAAMISANGWAAGLPSALSGGDVVCFWGSDFEYRGSNVYLGCMAANKSTIEGASYGTSGVSAMYYLSSVDANGNTVYAPGDETQSANLLTSFNHGGVTAPCVGELSVRWIPPLHRFLMTYGSATCGGLWYRTSATPWGPWTVEANFFPNDKNSGWMQKLIYPPLASATAPDPNTQTKVEMIDPVALPGTIINTESIAPYFQPGQSLRSLSVSRFDSP